MLEEFQRQQVPRARDMLMSIGPSQGHGRGKWFFNGPVGRVVNAEEIDALKIYFDPESKKILLRKTDPKDKNAFVVIKPTRNPLTSMGLSTPFFFDSIGWVSKRRVHVAVAWNAEIEAFEGVLPQENFGQRRTPLKPGPKRMVTRALQ